MIDSSNLLKEFVLFLSYSLGHLINKGSNMVFHALTFAREMLKAKGKAKVF